MTSKKRRSTRDERRNKVRHRSLDRVAACTFNPAPEPLTDSVDSDDVIRFTYNRQQQVTTLADQNGSVHSYDYDLLGRPTQDRVTTLGTGVDGTVRRLATTYDVRGLVETLTSYDNPTVGSGNVLNQCQYVYNDFGQLVTEYQSHDGTVNTSTTPKVQYTFADGSDNTIRPTGLVYPNGRTITYDYGTANGIDDRASRISAILDDDDSTLAGFAILGLGTFVSQTSPQPQLQWTLIDLDGDDDPDTGDIYSGFDRFGRVKDNCWYNYDAKEDVDRIQYGYDRASNRIWRHNVVAAALDKDFDEIYTYDAAHRLKTMERGLLNNDRTALTACGFAQCWQLDATGNWTNFRQADTDCNTWDLIQHRTASPVNEITEITNTTGPQWATPAYDRNGNMTTIPRDPKDRISWTNLTVDDWSNLSDNDWSALPVAPSFTATYDAWNRLVKMADIGSGQIVSQYAYDPAKRRILQNSYVEGVLDETRHIYFTQPSTWQALEERVGTSADSADPERQFVWNLRYIDGPLLRDRDTNNDGSLDERLYACQDANWNVTAIVDDGGSILERFTYSAYGAPLFLTDSFILQFPILDWGILFGGYKYSVNTSCYFARQREYVPDCGLWLQRDPTRYSDSPNLYLYVKAMPIRLNDPTGRKSCVMNIFVGHNTDIAEWFSGMLDVNDGIFDPCHSYGAIGCGLTNNTEDESDDSFQDAMVKNFPPWTIPGMPDIDNLLKFEDLPTNLLAAYDAAKAYKDVLCTSGTPAKCKCSTVKIDFICPKDIQACLNYGNCTQNGITYKIDWEGLNNQKETDWKKVQALGLCSVKSNNRIFKCQ